MASVPRIWVGETAVVLATGPSLTAEDVAYCQGRARVIAIKDAVRLAPWADVLYGAGKDTGRWWNYYGDTLTDFAGLRYTLDPGAQKWATVLRFTGEPGLETDPTALRTGKNSGYQAINLAVHLGASKIVLLGYDMQVGEQGDPHWFGTHPWKTRIPFGLFLPFFDTLVDPLRELGVEVINASRVSALTAFPRMSLAEALA